MRPLSLEIEGIRSFRAAQRIDFADLSFFAILGDTGAGKSSILEAMSYALFNSPTWLEKGVKDLMTTGASSMRVKFTFRIEGATCAITRLTPRVGAAQHLLEYFGDPPFRCDSDGAVSRFVRERLRLERETFMKTVMLPQGRFAELLLMKPADRANFLRDVLGLNVIELMADAARHPRDETARCRDSLRGARKELPENPVRAHEDAMRSAASATAALAAINESVQAIDVLSQIVEKQRTAVSAAQAGRILVDAGRLAVDQLSRLETDDARLRAVVESCVSVERGADGKRAETRAAIEQQRVSGTDAATLRALVGDLRTLVELEKQRAEANLALVNAQLGVAELRAEGESAESKSETAQRREQAAETDLRKLREDTARLRQRAIAIAAAAKSIETAAAEVHAAEAALKAAEHFLAASESASVKAGAKFQALEAALEKAKVRVEAARRANSAAHAGAGLHSGDACPVCNRVLPDGFTAPLSPKLTEVERLYETASKDRENAQRASAKADATKHQATVAIVACQNAVDARVKAFEGAIREAKPYELTEKLGDNDARWRSEVEKGTASQTALEALEQTLHDLRFAREAADEVRAEKRAALGVAVERFDGLKGRIESLDARIERTRTAMSVANRPAVDASPAELEVLITLVASSLGEAEVVESSLADDERRYSDALSALRRAKESWDRDVVQPRREILARLGPLVADVLAPRGLGLNVPAPEADTQDFAGFRNSLFARLTKAQEQLKSDADSASKRLEEAEHSLGHALAVYGVEDRQGLNLERDGRVRAAALADGAVVSAEKSLERATVIDARLAVIEPVSEIYGELADSLTPGRFPKFLVDRKQLELLRVGTTILGRMTGDRYGFSDDLGIVDRSINQERKAQTLSGGETFLASLALSLALVEISERSGVRFESLFLDEGFGTLDPAAFEQALIELERQVAQGRMIAVITHVVRVREFIDDVLRVTKNAEGSEVVLEQTVAAA